MRWVMIRNRWGPDVDLFHFDGVERKRERTVEWQHEGGNGDSGDSLLLLFRCAGRYQV